MTEKLYTHEEYGEITLADIRSFMAQNCLTDYEDPDSLQPLPLDEWDQLDENDWFGVTWSGAGMVCLGDKSYVESGAAHHKQRFMNICVAKRHALNTWLSCEPVINPTAITNAIPNFGSVDVWKIGKLNHQPSPVNWGIFGEVVEALCQAYGRKYTIKNDLRKAMEGECYESK